MLVRGIYVLFLRHWMEVFPRDQFLIFETEDARRNPHVVLHQLVEFLETSKLYYLNYQDMHYTIALLLIILH